MLNQKYKNLGHKSLALHEKQLECWSFLLCNIIIDTDTDLILCTEIAAPFLNMPHLSLNESLILAKVTRSCEVSQKSSSKRHLVQYWSNKKRETQERN